VGGAGVMVYAVWSSRTSLGSHSLARCRIERIGGALTSERGWHDVGATHDRMACAPRALAACVAGRLAHETVPRPLGASLDARHQYHTRVDPSRRDLWLFSHVPEASGGISLRRWREADALSGSQGGREEVRHSSVFSLAMLTG
jgi:hypothetical protein